MDELIDIYNENNEALKIQKMKSTAHRSGLWHRTSHIWVFNNKSEILLQLRSGEKEIFPNLWDISAAGHIGAGEKPIIAAIRETKEELGLAAEPGDLEFYTIRKQISQYKQFLDNEFHYVYFLKFNDDISNLVLQKEEVEDIKFYHTDFLKDQLNNSPGDFVPHGNYWFKIIDEVEKRSNRYAKI